jgi:hypothetical protein
VQVSRRSFFAWLLALPIVSKVVHSDPIDKQLAQDLIGPISQFLTGDLDRNVGLVSAAHRERMREMFERDQDFFEKLTRRGALEIDKEIHAEERNAAS